MDFERFGQLFPKSKFVKLSKFNEEELHDEDTRKKGKVPIDGRGLQHPLTLGEAQNWVTDGGRVGWIVPNNYIVIDIDNKDHPKSAITLEKILYLKNIKFWSNQSKQGTHFIFKNTEEVMKGRGTFAGMLTSLGIRADGRGSNKGYIILPANDEQHRQWKDWSQEEIDELPFFLRPLRPARDDDPIFIDMSQGGGSDALVKIRGIACATNMITNDQSVEALRIINEIIWSSPMPENMFQATVAREMKYENVQKADGTGPTKENVWRLLAQRLIQDYNLISLGDTIHMYQNGHYRPFSPHEIQTFILEKGNIDATASQRKETIDFIRALAQKDYTEINKDYAIIAVKNGMLDLNSGVLTPHSPDNYNTIYLDWEYKEDIEYSELIDNFMKQIADGDMRKMQFFYEVAGYCLLKRSIFEKFFIFKGTGGTGKSTFCNLIMRMVGKRYVSTVKLNQFDQDYYLATMIDKLVNIDFDASDKKTLEDSGRFKSITCSEPVSVRQIYAAVVEMVSCATVIINANHMPKIADKSDGLYRRMILVEIDKKIKNPDPKFLEKVTDSDMEYFFYKAVQGIHMALQRGSFTISTSEDSLKLKFQIGQSNLKKWLQSYQYCIADLVNKSTRDLFQEFKTYCLESNSNASNFQNFTDELLVETDLRLDFWKDTKQFYLERYDNDPRPDDHVFVPAEIMSRRNSKWG
jgi:putative DNA primase/helicase